MDIWMFICMIFVALAKIEYAVQLKVKFGEATKIGNVDTKELKRKSEKRYQQIDRYALVTFLVAYIMTVGFYFYTFH